MNMAESYYYENKVVAFVDILGFRNKTKNSESIAKKSVHTALTDIHNYIEALEKTEIFRSKNNHHYVFSDSSLFSCELRNISHLLSALATLQFLSAKNGCFMRGGIYYGAIFDKNNFFYGEALNKAYELESKTAYYPRIIFDSTFPFDEEKIDTTELQQDFDGCYYIDFLKKPLPLHPIDISYEENLYSYDNFSKIKEFIIQEIESNKKNTSIVAKYFWLVSYFNKSLESNNLDLTPINTQKLI